MASRSTNAKGKDDPPIGESNLTERESASPRGPIRFIRRDQDGRITISEDTRRPQRDRRMGPARTPHLDTARPGAGSHVQPRLTVSIGDDTKGNPRLEAIRDLIEQLETAAAAGDTEAAGFLEMFRAWAVRR